MARIGLIDVDGHNFPNLPLMKISAYHKAKGDSVEWYDPMFSGHMDRVYVSKVFSFTPDYEYFIWADEIYYGGSGYCISVENGKEMFDSDNDAPLPPEIEHCFPDYHLYQREIFVPDLDEDGKETETGHYEKVDMFPDTAYGFLTRGCPRGCSFCHVGAKEGRRSYKVADLSEFWRGQKNIVLLDPNPTACREWRDILQQLIDSGAWVDFTQGVDIRLITEEMAEMIKRIKLKNIHFAWDRYEDKEIILPKLKMFKELTEWGHWKMAVYVLINYNTTIEQDLERIYTLRDLGYSPYVMVYNKENLPQGHIARKIQRWVNARAIFRSTPRFEDYKG